MTVDSMGTDGQDERIPHRPSEAELIRRGIELFHRYVAIRNVVALPEGGPYTCPCCGHLTLDERGGYEICPECDWEDDGQDDHDSSVVRGGPNGLMSLDAARARYIAEGGTPQPHVPPTEPA